MAHVVRHTTDHSAITPLHTRCCGAIVTLCSLQVKFIDNQDVLDLVELKPNGLLPKLDDEVKVPKGSDGGYLDKIIKIHGENPRFRARVRRGNESRENEFGVNHYAGAVFYDVRGFLEKNKVR